MNQPPDKIGGSLIGSVHGNDLLEETIKGAYRHAKPSTPPSIRKRVLFVGWGRAGKDEAAQFAESHLGLRYGGSFSWHAKESVAAALGVHPMTAWETRHQNRQFWKDHCDALRRENQTLLAEKALATGDICAGLRDKVELDAVVAKRLFDELVWIDRPGTPQDFTVTFTREDVVAAGGWVIRNDGTLETYHRKLIEFFRRIGQPFPKLSDYARKLIESNFA